MKLWSILTVFAFQSHINFYSSSALSISPPSEEIFSNQLCPDPTTKVASVINLPGESTTTFSKYNSLIPQKILAINLDKPKESTHFYESCTFKEQWEPGSSSFTGLRSRQNVRVRSINLNVNSWNFSDAHNCSTFIKFNNWDAYDGGHWPVLCGRENFDQYLGPYGHPMILYYQWKKGAISFPLFHSKQSVDRKEALELQYMQMYFVVSGSKDTSTRKCRVQQYRLDWMRLGCSSVMNNEDEQVCGEYHCDELEELYQSKMTIFKDGESENDTMLVWKSKTDKYKMRTFLRQKFVPVVFLIVLICGYRSYMKAGLRYQNSIQDNISDWDFRVPRRRRIPPTITPTRPYHHQHHSRGTDPYVTDVYWNDDPPPQYINPDSPPSSTMQLENEIQIVQPKLTGTETPPPSYLSVASPPTYGDITKS